MIENDWNSLKKWLKMIKMIKNEWKWFKMIEKNSKWLKMNENDSKNDYKLIEKRLKNDWKWQKRINIVSNNYWSTNCCNNCTKYFEWSGCWII